MVLFYLICKQFFVFTSNFCTIIISYIWIRAPFPLGLGSSWAISVFVSSNLVRLYDLIGVRMTSFFSYASKVHAVRKRRLNYWELTDLNRGPLGHRASGVTSRPRGPLKSKFFYCCKQSLTRLNLPSVHPSIHTPTHPVPYFFIFY